MVLLCVARGRCMAFTTLGKGWAKRSYGAVRFSSILATEEQIQPSVLTTASLVNLITEGNRAVASILVNSLQIDESAVQVPVTAAVGNVKTKKAKKSGDDLLGNRVRLSNGVEGVIIAHRHPLAFVFVPRDAELLNTQHHHHHDDKEAQSKEVEILKDVLRVTPDESLWQSSPPVTCQDERISSLDTGRAIFASIPTVADIACIDEPFLTGVTAVDALTPIGKGQNMLLVAEGPAANRFIASALQATQHKAKCVYASTVPRTIDLPSSVALVTVQDSPSPIIRSAEAIFVAALACSIAEYWAQTCHEDSLVVVDTIDSMQPFWDFTTRTLLDLYGDGAIAIGESSEMRAFYSTLVQRAAKYNAQLGSKSMTLALLTNLPTVASSDIVYQASDFQQFNIKIRERVAILAKQNIPLTPAILQKLDLPIPPSNEEEIARQKALKFVDDLMSMTDGQIWWTPDNDQPDVRKSVTRIGVGADTKSRADAPAMVDLVGGLRFELAQATNTMATDAATLKQLKRRDAYFLAMNQAPGTVRTLADHCIVLLSAKLGYLDDAQPNVVDEMLNHVSSNSKQAVTIINDTLEMSAEAREQLERSLASFFSR